MMIKLQRIQNRLGEPVRRFGWVSNMAFLHTSFGTLRSGWVGSSKFFGVRSWATASTQDHTDKLV